MNNRSCRARIAAIALMGRFVATTARCGSNGGGGGGGIAIPSAEAVHTPVGWARRRSVLLSARARF